VAIPAVALILLVGSAARRWHLTLCTRVLAWAGLSGAGVGVYATFIEPFRLQVETVQLQLPAEREGFDVVRLAILSDLQTDRVTDYEQYAVSRLIALQPDAVFILGDVFQGSQGAFENQLPALRALLARLDAPSGVFLIPGNVDFPPERINRLAEGTRIQPLVNRIVRVTAGDRRLTIGGVEMDYRSPRARETIDQLESDGGRGDIRILLSHRPDVMLELRRSSRIDLVAAGHTHGGQVVIPGFGPPIISSRLPRVVGAGGLHEIDGRTIYVSRGVGHERGQAPRLRFFCPPAIDLITIPFRSRVPPSSGSPAVP
jgi:predicted MPP superfamily phosphohydrolase